MDTPRATPADQPADSQPANSRDLTAIAISAIQQCQRSRCAPARSDKHDAYTREQSSGVVSLPPVRSANSYSWRSTVESRVTHDLERALRQAGANLVSSEVRIEAEKSVSFKNGWWDATVTFGRLMTPTDERPVAEVCEQFANGEYIGRWLLIEKTDDDQAQPSPEPRYAAFRIFEYEGLSYAFVMTDEQAGQIRAELRL